MPEPVRVLMVALPPVLSEIVSGFSRTSPDVELVGHVAADGDLTEAVMRTDAQLLLCADEPDRAVERWAELLALRPPVAVVNLLDSGRRAELFGLREERGELADVSAAGLLESIRRRALVHAG
jgi:hypothetical protein